MKDFNLYIREGILQGDLHLFIRPDEEAEDDVPSCHCCGGPLYEADEMFSEECNECFDAFLEVTIAAQEEH